MSSIYFQSQLQLCSKWRRMYACASHVHSLSQRFGWTGGSRCGQLWEPIRGLTIKAATVEVPLVSTEVPTAKTVRDFRKRTRIRDIKGGDDGGLGNVGIEFEIRGWVRTVRNQKAFAFMEVNDGSTISGIQIVVQPEALGFNLIENGEINTGAAVTVFGELVESPGGKQKVELKARQIELVGTCDVSEYPLQKKRHTLEFLRGIAHLRPRTNTIGAALRVRSALAFATHQFFQQNGFQYIQTPLISAADCEGGGEVFQVTTLLKDLEHSVGATAPSKEDLKVLEDAVLEQGKLVRSAKQRAKEDPSDAAKSEEAATVANLLRLKKELEEATVLAKKAGGLPKTSEGKVDYTADFFGRPAYLTVSGQLQAECCACALTDVYTFGPTFRAENSLTSRHLAEFWMIEPEMAFADLADDMACAQAFLKHCVNSILTGCSDDLAFFEAQYEKGLIRRLQDVAEKPFATITYTEAVSLLKKSKAKFEFPVEWGADLQSEHERYLTEKEFQGTPLMVTDYPKAIKAFYMRVNDDDRTVAAMDMLVPRVGELMGGSQREERAEVLERRMRESGLEPEELWWYMELRKYGSVPHAGFGVGFERLVQFATGVDNIRDIIPFPRYPGHCDF
eukprot:jgi/Botrbrau1/9101/Bobra.0305s0008.1